MSEKVKFAHLHQRSFVPVLNKQVEKGIDDKQFPGVDMTLHFAGLDIQYQGHHVIIPYVNFQSLVMSDSEVLQPKEEKEEPKKGKNKGA